MCVNWCVGYLIKYRRINPGSASALQGAPWGFTLAFLTKESC